MTHHVTDLGDLERGVLELVWKHGPDSADTVQKQLDRPLKESTVRTVLTRLEEKGYLKHTVENRAFLYSATEPERPLRHVP
jgi:BlaI family transcriptional regulator, penicillinase repressor